MWNWDCVELEVEVREVHIIELTNSEDINLTGRVG